MAYEYRMKDNGAQEDSERALQKAADEIQSAIAELQKCQGMGAEKYISRLTQLANGYTGLKRAISLLKKIFN